MDRDNLIELIRVAFSHTDHPGDGFLLGSREGDDAFEAVDLRSTSAPTRNTFVA